MKLGFIAALAVASILALVSPLPAMLEAKAQELGSWCGTLNFPGVTVGPQRFCLDTSDAPVYCGGCGSIGHLTCSIGGGNTDHEVPTHEGCCYQVRQETGPGAGTLWYPNGGCGIDGLECSIPLDVINGIRFDGGGGNE